MLHFDEEFLCHVETVDQASPLCASGQNAEDLDCFLLIGPLPRIGRDFDK